MLPRGIIEPYVKINYINTNTNTNTDTDTNIDIINTDIDTSFKVFSLQFTTQLQCNLRFENATSDQHVESIRSYNQDSVLVIASSSRGKGSAHRLSPLDDSSPVLVPNLMNPMKSRTVL